MKLVICTLLLLAGVAVTVEAGPLARFRANRMEARAARLEGRSGPLARLRSNRLSARMERSSSRGGCSSGSCQ